MDKKCYLIQFFLESKTSISHFYTLSRFFLIPVDLQKFINPKFSKTCHSQE